jgi:AraC-like DNA-binding protein
MNQIIIPQYQFNNRQTELDFEIISLERIKNHARKNEYKPHRLDFYQLIVITRGRGQHEVDFEMIPYAENTVIPVAKGQVQRFIENPQLEGYAILFKPDFLVKEELDYHYLYDFSIFLSSMKPSSCKTGKEVFTLLQEMILEQEKEDAFDSAEYQRNLLKNFLIMIERSKRQRTEIVCNDSFQLYLKFRKELEENVNYKLRVSDICGEINASAKQVNTAVKLMTNTTAKKYLEDRVILEIKRLLVYSSLSVKEIAYQVGFEDPTNFTKYFKSRVHMLPSEYQKKQRL